MHYPPLFVIQEIKRWKHNRFDPYKKNTRDTAIRNLQPGTNGEAAAVQMLSEINADKKELALLFDRKCVAMWLDAADVCNLTVADRFKPNTRLSCHKPGDIAMAWRECSGPVNCKRMAFIFDYYGTELHQRALNTTHQVATTKNIMDKLGIVMDVLPEDMRSGQKTCVEQMYSYASKNRKNNISRVGWKRHHVRVNLGEGETKTTSKNWKRPKEVFFNSRNDPNEAGKTIVQKVCKTMHDGRRVC
jgi:hypothetical protein